ncbi:MAG TPA: hypothetical protein VJ731_18275 [Terriglobales bacterium]|nr:hypothetical protein [Terriglobales bacterium]
MTHSRGYHRYAAVAVFDEDVFGVGIDLDSGYGRHFVLSAPLIFATKAS